MDEDQTKALAIEIDGLVAEVVGLLAGKPERVAASALAGAVATWIATLPDDAERQRMLSLWLGLVEELVGLDLYRQAASNAPHLNS